MVIEVKRIEVTLETLLESVDLAEAIVMRIAESAGFGDEDCHKIGMSVREGAINACQHAHQQDRARKIFLKIELEGNKRMIVHILDQGKGFEPEKVPDPLAEENLLRSSGRGLFLMKAFMDEFSVHRAANGGTELIMAKYIPPKGSNHRPRKVQRRET